MSYLDKDQHPARDLLTGLLELGLRQALTRPAQSDEAAEIEQMTQALTAGSLSSLSVHGLAERARKVDRVEVTTMLSSKGLEFDVVLILGADEGVSPHFLSKRDTEKLDEDRRKFYVSVTRARDEVRIFYSGFVEWPSGKSSADGPSRFLTEIGLIPSQQPLRLY
jgi:DNA helicase II / ATP-dependent DNA helicase PcrA